MASDIIQPSAMDNFRQFHWQANNVQQAPNCRRDTWINIRKHRPIPHHMPKFCAQKRPQFLRLDSAGENIDTSLEPQETGLLQESGFQGKCNPTFDCRTKRSSGHNISGESLPKARRTTYSCQSNLQSNNPRHSKGSLNSTELDQLATKFSSCSPSEQKSASCGIQSKPELESMAGACSERTRFQGGKSSCPPLIPDSNMGAAQFSGYNHVPPQFFPPPTNQTHMTQNFMGMPISMLNFRPHPFSRPPPRWGNPQLSFGPPANFTPWAVNGHFLPVQNNSIGSPQVNVLPQGAQFGIPLSFWHHPAQHNPQRTKQNACRQQSHSAKKRHSKPPGPRNNERTFTRILKRPSEAVASCDSEVRETPARVVNSIPKVIVNSSHAVESSKVLDSCGQTDHLPRPNNSMLNAKCHMQALQKGSDKVAESKSLVQCQEENNIEGNKQRHSSIDFLLGGLKISQDSLSDSDFVDCDWDTLDNPQHHDKTWVDSFVTDDPYNPLTGWRCSKRSPLDELVEDDREITNSSNSTRWSSDSTSRDFDSGTESGSDTESDGDLEDIPDEQKQSEGSEQRQSTGTAKQPKPANDGRSISCDSGNGTPGSEIRSIQKSQGTNDDSIHGSRKNGESSVEATSKQQRCLHPSISYVLGGYDNQHASDDASDAESDDWDDFSDSDDEPRTLPGEFSAQFAPPSLDNLRLFHFSNSQFKNPCLPSSTGPQVVGIERSQKGITSPSAPCGPIFKPKARTVLISQRIICQVSDQPVSMVVPLEQSGRMSHNLMPSIQVGQRSPRRRSSPTTSCMKQHRSRCRSKASKQVHFNNKATLIVCPEPSHLAEEIRRARRGPWLDYARDRCRFQHRITHIERVISPCLSSEHREKVAERFKAEVAPCHPCVS